ncbi:MAG: 50S ribosomal protein L11 methyltransferase [Candidatus Pacebacteria bacterium]|nr:50S ribosomal protein L11 methyltransferase [Candidatus Paceibacterota bacterium]
MDETFSSIELITECMSDTERTTKLVKAIEHAVKEGDTVLDCGTGSAILALTAARAGASKVIALEFDPYVAKLAQQNIERNGLQDKVEIILTDARNVTFPTGTRFDVVIMEMLTTGMVDEYQVWAVNNLHEKGVVDSDTLFVPQRQDTFITLANKDFVAQGFEMRMIRHIWSWLPDHGLNFLSDKTLLSSISFSQKNSVEFKEIITLPVTESGVVNSVFFTSVTKLDDELSVGDTLALNAPVVFPLEEDISVIAGDTIKLEIAYMFGNGYRNMRIKKL